MDSLPRPELPAPLPPPRTASLRRFVLAALVAIIVGWTLAQLATVRALVTLGYEEFEIQDGLLSARRLDGFMRGELERMMRIARDWGYWDDTLAFVEGRRPGFIAENLSSGTLENLAVDMMAFADADGRLFESRTSSARRDAEPAAILRHVMARAYGHEVLAAGREVAGLLRTDHGLMALVVLPVLDNERRSLPRGALILGRAFDHELLAEGQEHNVFEAELFLDGDPAWPADVARWWSARDAAERLGAAPIDDGRLGVYALLSDLDGKAVGVLRSLEPRDTKRRFEQMGSVLLGISLLLAGMIALAALWVLERRVISPIAAIGRVVGRVARDGDLAQRVPESGSRDELAQLGREINLMLAEIANQQQLREARDRALAASAQKSEFLANMSHEIRTPMNGILGMLELVLETALTPQQQERVQTAYRSAEGLLALLNDILDLSKLEAGKLQLEQREFDLREVVENLVILFAPDCEQKGIAISCHVDPALECYVGDPLRVRQVLSNLLGNAVKFTARGEVSIEVGPGADADELRVVVADTGIGIEPDRLQQLFQPFTQVDSSMARRYGGTGLGLAISRQLVERMQGRIEVASEAGRGTRFTCTLRLQPVPARTAPSRPHVGRRALVYGPADGTRASLTGYLRALGFDVRHQLPVAQSGDFTLDEVALLAVDDTETDAVIGRLRMRARERGIAVLRLSNFARSMPGIAPGASREQILSKPVLWRKLQHALEVAFVAREDPSSIADTTKAPPPPRIAPLAELRGRRVLLVEDNLVNQALALGMLETYELEVDCAENGIEALEKLGSARYDLVLMDCQMPDMDGLEATRRWRASEAATAGSHVPIVALTANAMSGDREICLAAGMDGYLAKPYNRAALTEILRQWMPAPSADARTPATNEPCARLDVA
ncbi:MAG: ATP-binding protein [Gammaproteobacteria bacterium]